MLTTSPRSNARMASSASPWRRRWSDGLMPIMCASRGDLARAGAEDEPSAGLQIELSDAVGRDQRVVIGQRRHACAELDALGSLCGGRDEHVRGRHDLGAGRMMLTHPRFFESEVVQVCHEVDIASELQGGIGVERMVRGRGRLRSGWTMRTTR